MRLRNALFVASVLSILFGIQYSCSESKRSTDSSIPLNSTKAIDPTGDGSSLLKGWLTIVDFKKGTGHILGIEGPDRILRSAYVVAGPGPTSGRVGWFFENKHIVITLADGSRIEEDTPIANRVVCTLIQDSRIGGRFDIEPMSFNSLVDRVEGWDLSLDEFQARLTGRN